MRKKLRVFVMFICVTLWLLFPSGTLLALEETGGIGLEVSQLYNHRTKDPDKRGSIVVLNVLKGSPAQIQGIQKGDIILQIGEMTTSKRDFIDLLHNHLRGPSITDVKLVIWRPSSREKIEFNLQRVQMVY